MGEDGIKRGLRAILFGNQNYYINVVDFRSKKSLAPLPPPGQDDLCACTTMIENVQRELSEHAVPFLTTVIMLEMPFTSFHPSSSIHPPHPGL